MSRCFPFPPPGYEKKARPEDIDLLKKEKSREKKHKKEKRDKEKKDGKEKRDKDRSSEKQKEKKEKKEKHRDKRKDKEKIRDKDKNNHVISDEKKFYGHAEAEKGEQNYEKSKEREKEKSTVNSTVYNGVVLGKNNHLPSEKKIYKQLDELGSKNGNEEGKLIGISRNRVDGVSRQVEKNIGKNMEVKEKIKGIIDGDVKKSEKRKDEDREKSVDKYMEKVKKMKVERPKDMVGEMVLEQSRIRDSNKVHADLLRMKDGNKKDVAVPQSAARPVKLVKEDIRAAAAAASTTPEMSRKRKDFSPNGVLYDGEVGPNKAPRITSSSIPVTENGRRPFQNSIAAFAAAKQQQVLSNAYKQDEADIAPSKTARITSSSLLLTENGRNTPMKLHPPTNTPMKQQPSQESNILLKQQPPSNTHIKQQPPSNTPIKQQPLSSTPVSSSPLQQQTPSKVKQSSKEHRINGTNKSPQSSSRSSSRAAKKLLPHPDTKYLPQVLSVPTMEEWSGFDEQEWLFSSSSSSSMVNKPSRVVDDDDTVQQVWAEAVRIESVDVYALPYVIPR